MATSILQATSLDFQSSGATQAKITASANSIDFEGVSAADVNLTGLNSATASGTITAGTLTDSTATLTAGALSGVTSIDCASVTATGAVEGLSVTDGVATMTTGSLTGVVNATASGIVTAGTFTDGTATLTGGSLTGLIAPTQASEAANKAYVDGIASGLCWRESVRVASIVSGNLASDFENGDTVDGITLASGDRILIKDQASASENGIYIVEASGAPTRATDFEVGVAVASYAVFVEEGTSNADEGFVCTNDSGSDVVGTDALVFTQFTGLGSITAGDGLQKTGNTVSVDSTVVRTTGNQTIQGVKTFSDTTQASSASIAGTVFSGGVGIAQDVRCGGEMYAIAFNATSDENYKQDIMDIDIDDLDKLMNVRAVSYRFKGISDESKTRYGILAQDLEEKGLGHMVSTDVYGTKKVNYNDLVGLLIGQVQDLKQEIEVLKDII